MSPDTLSGSENARARARAQRSECLRAMNKPCPTAWTSPGRPPGRRPHRARPFQAGGCPPHSHLCEQPSWAPGEAGAPLSERPHPGLQRSLHPAHGLLLGRDKIQERKGSGKALLPQKTSVQGHAGRRRPTHEGNQARASQLPAQQHHKGHRESSYTKEIGKRCSNSRLPIKGPCYQHTAAGFPQVSRLTAQGGKARVLKLSWARIKGEGRGGHQAGTALAPFNSTPNILTPF